MSSKITYPKNEQAAVTPKTITLTNQVLNPKNKPKSPINKPEIAFIFSF